MVLCVVVFQVPLFIPALFSFTCLFMVALSLYSDPVNTGIGFAITLTGVPAYYLFIVWDKKPKWFRKLLGEIYTLGQKISKDSKIPGKELIRMSAPRGDYDNQVKGGGVDYKTCPGECSVLVSGKNNNHIEDQDKDFLEGQDYLLV
ncbi:hypothetical protein ASZ78_000229 [Callipepla squamata]|uniref:Uncharacterized protein n=1 Tax=Callipepla squamata TaxID=9009 RepID=A0A226MQR8_CALSU|nr:hypothetical protein ASZ78_000229 [Callipepla squamata]